MGKLVKLEGGAKAKVVNEDLVAFIEDLLADAKAGKVGLLAALVKGADGSEAENTFAHAIQGNDTDLIWCIGALDAFKMDLLMNPYMGSTVTEG